MKNNSQGFTLLELIIGITILMIVIATAYASYSIGLRTYRTITQENYANQNIRQAWRELSRDLRCAYVSNRNNNFKFISTQDTVTFVTFLPGRDLSSCGLTEVTYRITSDPQSEYTGLIREDSGLPFTDQNEPVQVKTREVSPLATSLKLSYFDGMNWKDGWGLDESGKPTVQANSLPLSVKIEVTVADNTGAEKKLATIVPVMAAN